jgi:hypothetical protein
MRRLGLVILYKGRRSAVCLSGEEAGVIIQICSKLLFTFGEYKISVLPA